MKRSLTLDVIIRILLFMLVLAIYGQILGHDFVNLDDHVYVTNNPYVRSGLDMESIRWAFTSLWAEFWHPLTWLSLMLDSSLYGLNPVGYHFTNLILHLLNTLLLFSVLNRMTGQPVKSGFVAALFAAHPLHVESVAWISERKDVLSTFFWIMTLWGYARYAEKPAKKTYLTLILFFILGLMSKPMLITLPFVLLLLDFWPLRRIAPPFHPGSIPPLLKEKIPLFLIMAVFAVLSVLAQYLGGGVGSLEAYPLFDRIANAILSYNKYLFKTLWPLNLSVFYPFPKTFPAWQAAASLLVLLIISACAVRWAEKRPYVIVGWLWFLGTLIPVIGLVKIGDFAMADRYMYVPLIGLSIIMVWGGADLLRACRVKPALCASAGIFIIIALTLAARSQARYWKNSIELYKHALAVASDNYFAHYGMAQALEVEGRLDEAVSHFYAASRQNPSDVVILKDLGRALVVQGRLDKAQTCFLRAILIEPAYENAHYCLGLVLVLKGRLPEGIRQFNKALEKKSAEMLADSRLADSPCMKHYLSGKAYETNGDTEKAAGAFQTSLAARSDFLPALRALAGLYAKQRAYRKALSLYNIPYGKEGLGRAVMKGYANWPPVKPLTPHP